MHLSDAGVLISAPFGNYLRFAGCVPTLGTFTWRPRGGLAYRLWRCLWTLRYRRGLGWTNQLGLPNPGIKAARADCSGAVVSVHGFHDHEWVALVDEAATRNPLAIELNLSCPNVPHRQTAKAVSLAVLRTVQLHGGLPLIAKLPPVRWMDLAVPLYGYGVRAFHCCNTIPTPSGGLSGPVLRQYSLWATEEIKQRFGADVWVVGGGGISCAEDARLYRRAGADAVAVGSMLLNPLNWRRVGEIVAAMREGT